ncbi:MAG: hypothetical protein ABIJ96_04725 [Elusimicrobiota bacterium]
MDKKALLIGVGMMVLIGGVIAGANYLLIDTSQETEYNAVETQRKIDSAGQPSFPTKQLAASSDPISHPDDLKPKSTGEASSLGMVRGAVQQAGGTSPGSPSQSAAEAAQSLDAQGVLKGIREDGGDVPDAQSGLTNSRIRQIMQEVVDGVHQMQPVWYNEFLANKYLKQYADQYDKDRDFPAFLTHIGKSKAFRDMLKEHYKTKAMRSLTSEMFADKNLREDLLKLFFHVQDHPYVIKLVSLYGQGAGLPSTMVKTAKSKSGTKPVAKKRRQTRPRSRPQKLRKIGYEGYQGGDAKGAKKPAKQGGAPPGMPDMSNIDKSQIPPEYQKLLEKR